MNWPLIANTSTQMKNLERSLDIGIHHKPYQLRQSRLGYQLLWNYRRVESEIFNAQKKDPMKQTLPKLAKHLTFVFDIRYIIY